MKLIIVIALFLCSTPAWAADIYLAVKPATSLDGVDGLKHTTVIVVPTGESPLSSSAIAYRGGCTNCISGSGTPPITSVGSTAAISGGGAFGQVTASVLPFDKQHPDYPNASPDYGMPTGFKMGLLASNVPDPSHGLGRTAVTIEALGYTYNPGTNNSNTVASIGLQVIIRDYGVTLDSTVIENLIGGGGPFRVEPLNAPGWGHVLSQNTLLGLPVGETFDGFRVTPPAPPPLAPSPTVPMIPQVPQVISEPPAPPGLVPTPVVPTVPQTVAVDTDVWGRLCIVTCREIHNLTPEQEASLLALGGTVVQPSRSGQAPVVQTNTTPLVTFPTVVTPLPLPGTGTPVFLPGTVVIPSVEVGQLVDPVTGLPYGDPGGTVTFPPFTPVFTPVFTDFGNIKLPDGGFGFGPFSMMNSAMITNPEPGTWLLMGTGLGVLLWVRRAAAKAA